MNWFINQLEKRADQIAIVDTNESFSYSELYYQVLAYRRELDLEIESGKIVAILSDYNFYSVALFFALFQKHAVIVPIVSANIEEIDRRTSVVKPCVVIRIDDGELVFEHKSLQSQYHPMVQSLISGGNAGLILFSSGSTGEPKAMVHNLDNLINSYHGKKSKNLCILVFLMFDHIGGLNTLLNALSIGAKVVFPAIRNPDHVARLIQRFQVNVLPSSPTFLNLMLMAGVHDRYDLSSIKMITYGTESMPESLLEKIKAVFPRARLLQTFGTSETGIVQTKSRSSDSLEIRFDDPSAECKIVNGELWIRSKTQVLGYINSSMDSFTEDGWFRTGDLVEQSDGGFIRIRGRLKEIINVGGEKVLPSEVESVVLELEFVDDCMVFGEKTAITGQMVSIQVVLAEEFDHREAKRLIRRHCKDRLEAYKIPVKFEFVAKTNFGERFKKKRI
jgi:acyl-CoA synthetase (AMP-forming)/AMP-acid ligase II